LNITNNVILNSGQKTIIDSYEKCDHTHYRDGRQNYSLTVLIDARKKVVA